MHIKLSNSQVNKFENFFNCFGYSNEENNLPYKLLLTNTQVPKLCKTSTNYSSGNTKLSKTQLRKIGQSGGYLNRPLLNTVVPLILNVLKPLDKRVLIPLGLKVVASATDAAIH